MADRRDPLPPGPAPATRRPKTAVWPAPDRGGPRRREVVRNRCGPCCRAGRPPMPGPCLRTNRVFRFPHGRVVAAVRVFGTTSRCPAAPGYAPRCPCTTRDCGRSSVAPPRARRGGGRGRPSGEPDARWRSQRLCSLNDAPRRADSACETGVTEAPRPRDMCDTGNAFVTGVMNSAPAGVLARRGSPAVPSHTATARGPHPSEGCGPRAVGRRGNVRGGGAGAGRTRRPAPGALAVGRRPAASVQDEPTGQHGHADR